MYTPPQIDDGTSSHGPGGPTYLFQPVGIGRKDKREQWVWKSEVNQATRPQPFSYEYVIEEGRLPTITVHHPTNPISGPRLHRKLSKRTKRPDLARHSSPASPACTARPPPSPTPTTTKLKRALSLALIRMHRPSLEEDVMNPLPPAPPVPPVPRVESAFISEAIKPNFERSFFDETDANGVPPPKPSVELSPSTPRRSSVTNPVNATPRMPKAPRISPQPLTGKDTLVSPILLKEDLPDQPSPARTPQSISPHPASAEIQVSHETRPILQRQKSKFVERFESPCASAELDSTPSPSAAAQVAQPGLSNFSRPRPTKVSFSELPAAKSMQTPAYIHSRQLSLAIRTPPSPPTVAIPRRAATVKLPTAARAARAAWADSIRTAEAMPVLMSPIVASGTARLVSC